MPSPPHERAAGLRPSLEILEVAQARLDLAANVLFAIAALNLLLGTVAMFTNGAFLQAMGLGWTSVLAGAGYGALAILMRERSMMAMGLTIAVSLFMIEGAHMFIAAAALKVWPPIGGLLARILLLLPLLRGFGALRALSQPLLPRRSTPRRLATAPGDPAAPSAGPELVKRLSGDAEKLRLRMSERNAVLGPTLAGRRVDVKFPKGVDAASKSLRFIAHRCEIGEEGLRVTLPNGQVREVRFDQVGHVVARQLPPDPPWDGALFLDVVPEGGPSSDPVRIFGTTVVNYTAIPGGSTSSRIDNTRRLVAFLQEHCPNLTLDEATDEFVRGPNVPQRFVSMTNFIEYDATYSQAPLGGTAGRPPDP